MPPKGMTWDAENDRKLLLGIIRTHNITVDAEAMAAYMASDGQNCTAEAIRGRIKKLKSMAKDAEVGGSPAHSATTNGKGRKCDSSEDAEEGTPAKKTKSTKKKAEQGGKPKPASVQHEEGADDDELTGDEIKEEKEE